MDHTAAVFAVGWLLCEGTVSRDHDGDVVEEAEAGVGDGSVGLCKYVQARCGPKSLYDKTEAERHIYLIRPTHRTYSF